MKKLLKSMAGVVAWVIAAPLAYPVAWTAALDRRHLVFQCASHMMSLWPGIIGVYIRRQYYRTALGLKSTGFVIEFGTILAQRGIEIGNNVYVGPFCNIGLSTLEDDVLLGSNVDIVSGKRTHFFDRLDVPIREQEGTLEKIRIGAGSWVGNKSVVMATIGKGCVVGAGSVVTSAFEDLQIIAGNPARAIRSRDVQHTEMRSPEVRP